MLKKNTPRLLNIDKALEMSPEKMHLLGKFCCYCILNIPVRDNVKISVVNDREANDIKTTASYNMGNHEIIVYGKNRALVDICRSIAHELVHQMQDETGLIDGPVQDVGGFHENQANAGAGALIKAYAQSQPEGRKIYESLKVRKVLKN